MKRWALCGAVVLTMAGCTSSTTSQSTTGQPAASQPATGGEPAAREAAASFYSALNVMFTGEVGPMTEVWSHRDDVTYMGPTGGLKTGWAAVRKDWEAQAALKLGGTVKPEDMHVTVDGGLAVVQNVEKGENVVDGKPQIVSIRATSVFRFEDGKWKMMTHHTDLLPYLAK